MSLSRSLSPRAPSLSGQSLTNASMSTTAHSFVVRYDKLDQNEVKDLLLCFLYVVKNLSEGKRDKSFEMHLVFLIMNSIWPSPDILLGWFNNSSEYDILDFFSILEWVKLTWFQKLLLSIHYLHKDMVKFIISSCRICLQQFKYIGKKRITSLA